MKDLKWLLAEDIEFYQEKSKGYHPNSEEWKRANNILDGISIALRKLGYGSVDEFKERHRAK